MVPDLLLSSHLKALNTAELFQRPVILFDRPMVQVKFIKAYLW